MEDFKVQQGLNVESLSNETYVDAAGKVWPIYSQRIAAVAGKFGNAGATTLAHGIAAPKLDGPFNVRKVNCNNGVITADKSMMTITMGAANLNIVTTTNL